MSRIAVLQENKLGHKLRNLRLYLGLSRVKLAERAGISLEEMELFEQGLPVLLDTRLRILKELLAIKAESMKHARIGKSEDI